MTAARRWGWLLGMPRPCLVLVCALALSALTALVAAGVAIPGDAEFVYWVVSLRSETLTRIIQMTAFVSSSIPALIITLVVSGIELLRAKRLRVGVAWATAAYLGATACNIALRVAIGRQRPAVDYVPNLLPELQAGFQRFSYPSGHAGAAFLAYSSLVVLVWPRAVWRWIALAGVLLVVGGVGFGRVYLGVHWPTDVWAGYLLGACWFGLGLTWRVRAGLRDGLHQAEIRRG